MGICEVLTIIFVVCKLMGVISWSWLVVLSPEIIAIALYIIILVVSISTANKAKKHFKNFDF